VIGAKTSDSILFEETPDAIASAPGAPSRLAGRNSALRDMGVRGVLIYCSDYKWRHLRFPVRFPRFDIRYRTLCPST
jgi:hypothetical protein